MEKSEYVGRVKKNCKRCNDLFSTHSSNRDLCHKCRPKCRERHYFFVNKKNRQEILKDLENKEKKE